MWFLRLFVRVSQILQHTTHSPIVRPGSSGAAPSRRRVASVASVDGDNGIVENSGKCRGSAGEVPGNFREFPGISGRSRPCHAVERNRSSSGVVMTQKRRSASSGLSINYHILCTFLHSSGPLRPYESPVHFGDFRHSGVPRVHDPTGSRRDFGGILGEFRRRSMPLDRRADI